MKNEDLTYKFYELGFTEQIALSAQSGRQVGLLLDKIESLIPVQSIKNTFDDLINFSIVGMPNVGKSSILNALIQREQAIVSDIAGTSTTITTVDEVTGSSFNHTNRTFTGTGSVVVDTPQPGAAMSNDFEFYLGKNW